MTNAKFITFEGIEGAGKSTQLKLAASFLESQGISVLCTREPGATPLGKELRRLLLDPDLKLENPMTETLLFTADRLEHLQTCIVPALEKGTWVLSDRYIDSTIAYQHGGRQIPLDDVLAIANQVSLMPDCTFLLDSDPMEGLRRASERADLDRFEKEDVSFHERVRSVFLDRAEMEPDRFNVISVGNLTKEAVLIPIIEQLRQLLEEEDLS